MSARGFSLLEAVVALGIGTSVAVAGLVLTADLQRFQHRHAQALAARRDVRGAVRLISQDVRNAGVGAGYRPDGRFAGLLAGRFSVPGGAVFAAEGRPVETPDGQLVVDDLGVRRALGSRRTILYLEEGTGEICAGLDLRDDQLLVASSRSGRAARTLRVTSATDGICTRGQCVGGCTRLGWTPDATYLSHPGAVSAGFTAGDLFTEFETVVWFVARGEDGRAQLRRVGARTADACAAPDATCGALVAEGIELLQYRVSAFDPSTRAWEAVSLATEIATPRRLRVDLELVARGRSDPGVGTTPLIESQLEPGLCIPGPCGQPERDGVPRVALRTTVEVRNAGRLRIR